MPDHPGRSPSEASIIASPAYRKVIAALAQSEERYRALVEGVRRYAMYMLSAEGTPTKPKPASRIRQTGPSRDHLRAVGVFCCPK